VSAGTSCMATLEGAKVGVPRARRAPSGEQRAMYWRASQAPCPDRCLRAGSWQRGAR